MLHCPRGIVVLYLQPLSWHILPWGPGRDREGSLRETLVSVTISFSQVMFQFFRDQGESGRRVGVLVDVFNLPSCGFLYHYIYRPPGFF